MVKQAPWQLWLWSWCTYDDDDDDNDDNEDDEDGDHDDADDDDDNDDNEDGGKISRTFLTQWWWSKLLGNQFLLLVLSPLTCATV